MGEYLQKRWRCDFCGRDVNRSTMPPAGWVEIDGYYGNYAHCCPDVGCRHKAIAFCDENGFSVPELLEQTAETLWAYLEMP